MEEYIDELLSRSAETREPTPETDDDGIEM